jgi:hypothetical protein
VDEYKFLRVVKRMLDDLEKTTVMTKDWWKIATNILQSTTGARWIEAAFVSKFELSELDQFDKDIYVIVRGIAKENAKALRKIQREYDRAIERGDENPLDSLGFMGGESEQEMLESMIPERIISRPTLFHSLGITPEYVVTLSKQVKQYVINTIGKRGKDVSNEKYRSLISRKLYQAPNNYFKSLWTTADLLGFKNTTHTWRKLYVDYSFKIFGNGGTINQQAWIEDTLGHESIQTSFHYSTVQISTSVKSTDKAINTEIAGLKFEVDTMKKLVRDLLEKREKEKEEWEDVLMADKHISEEENVEVKFITIERKSNNERVNIPVFKRMKGFRITNMTKQPLIYDALTDWVAAFFVYYHKLSEEDIRAITTTNYRLLVLSENIYKRLKKNHPIPVSMTKEKLDKLQKRYIEINQ